ncbi:hypothetical protein [Methanosarcina sp. Kolksee]|uniref:hypothetical protein n=1 Tax=Methanosarcina sp. Kolksee TaxID=1434099 RepID=UPI000A5D69A5|nr:hypothetical protein [Methanosarcina sp. Kolksee]
MEFCNTENAACRIVILSGYYNHGKHGKHGRNTPLLLISVSSVLSVVFKKFISDILWNRCTGVRPFLNGTEDYWLFAISYR